MIFEVKDLSFSYEYSKNSRDSRNKGDAKKVLKNISFELRDGDFACILGPNGTGKSTLFKCILNRLQKYDGDVIIDGTNVKNMNYRTLSKYMAYIPQTFDNVYDFTVSETVLFGTAGSMNAFEAPKKEQEEKCIEALRKVGMEEFYDRSMNKLSGGEKQMVYIARAVAQNAKMLIMDEPTSALDFGNQIKALECIQGLSKEGYIVLTSTHDPQQALQYSNKTLAIKSGQVLGFGNTRDIINEELLTELYNQDIRIFEVGGMRVVTAITEYTHSKE